MKKLYLIDGSGFIFRAYHSLPPLTNPAGTPVGAVYGFINMMLKLMEGAKADHIAVIFDAGRKTFRNDIYPEYKAHRPPPPEDLIPQFPLVREATQALNLPAIEMPGFEADDLIATYATAARAEGMEVVIVSSDKDLMQLIGPGISMYDGMKQKSIGPEQVMEKFGVPPEKVRDVLSLMGDSSDNIPGVPGIGPKTAAELIGNFGTLEGVLANAANIKQNKRRETIEQNSDKARLSYELVGLKSDIPLPVPITSFACCDPESEKLMPFLTAMGFKSLIAKFSEKFGLVNTVTPAKAGASPGDTGLRRDDTTKNYELVQDEAALARWIDDARAKGVVAFDTETTSLNAMQAELVGFSLCSTAGKACYVPVAHKASGIGEQVLGSIPDSGDLFSPKVQSPKPNPLLPGQLPLERAISLLKPLLEDASVLKIGQNIKYDMLVLKKYGIGVTPLEDTMLLSYILAAGSHNHNMDELAERYLGLKTISYDQVTGTGKARIPFAEVALDKALAYAAEDADVTFRLWQVLKPQVADAMMLTLYETIERPLVPVVVAMEERGIKVNQSALAELSGDFATRMEKLEKEVHALAGHPFNIASPKQLGEVLFDEMSIPGGKKGKTGAYGTGAEVLEELADSGHTIAQKILDWRQLAKLKSTYTDTLAEEINPQTRRVHTSYSLALTSTGRLSSNSPNLQNIPIRTEEGRKIRHAFVAEQGNLLISADYSQIELRLLAHIADIPVLKEAFKNGDDIHAITASQMFGVPVQEVSGDLRRKAKTINFGIIYGISAHGLAARLGISRSEAGAYIEKYFAQYPGIQAYMERTKKFAHEHGYVETLFGRRCHVPGINDKNPNMRNFSERAAINAPLQGTAADIIKRAMIAVEHELTLSLPLPLKVEGTPSPFRERAGGEGPRMLLQVHDELIIEAPEAQAESVAANVRKIMESAAHLSVPLTVEASFATNWGDAH